MNLFIYENELTKEKVTGLEPNRKTVRAILKKEDKYSVILMKSSSVYMFIGGGINEEEDIFDALQREVLEETGIKTKNEKEVCVIHNYAERRNKLEYWHCTYFLCEIASEGHPLNLEDYEKEIGLELKWYNEEEMIRELTYHESNHPFGASIQRRELMAFTTMLEKGD
jgi:8-oxo-dGTP pyrophosphatase MutT (NUDIX family)